ncbi:MAG TPA: MIP/aquaporin family protein [Rhizomicrobium sp.]|jgi:glycerol uptake facilitator-like aquaporin
MTRSLAAEFLGTLVLLATIVGSGIMGDRLAGGNVALALLANSLATGAVLVVLITLFAPLSGAHFNPAVTLYFTLQGEITWRHALTYVAVQLMAAVAGVWLAHAMFALPVLQVSTHLRDGPAQWLAEFTATFGLILTIAGGVRFAPAAIPMLVGLYITGAYWFTASTSFANPAVTVARTLTRSFSGIAPRSAPGFIAAQLLAALISALILPWLFARKR